MIHRTYYEPKVAQIIHLIGKMPKNMHCSTSYGKLAYEAAKLQLAEAVLAHAVHTIVHRC